MKISIGDVMRLRWRIERTSSDQFEKARMMMDNHHLLCLKLVDCVYYLIVKVIVA